MKENVIKQLTAVVNNGRWIVDCPVCRSALAVKLLGMPVEFSRFGCIECGYGLAGEHWENVKRLPVEYRMRALDLFKPEMQIEYFLPRDYVEIEEALLKRLHHAWQNWLPGMTAQELVDATPFLHFSWTAPATWVVNQVVTASDLNIQLRDNVGETMPAKVLAKGDLAPATGANALARLPVGANGAVLTADSAEAVGMKWATPGTLRGVQVRRSSDLTLTGGGARDVIGWNLEDWDTNAFHDNATNNSRLTIPIGASGNYFVYWAMRATSGTTQPQIFIRKNGGTDVFSQRMGWAFTGDWTITGHAGVPLVAGDYLEFTLAHDGNNAQIFFSGAHSRFGLFLLF